MIKTMKAMKTMAKWIVNALDIVSGIIPIFMLSDWCPEKVNPIAYGLSVLGGLIFCACAAFGVLLVVGMIVCAVASFPITSCSIVLVLGLFIGIGYLRKKIGRKLK